MIAFAQEENHAKENQKPVAAERDVREVLVIKQQYDEALLRGDSTWFEQAFAEDYLLILGDATTHTKGQIVKQLASRQVIWQRAAGRDMDVRMYGDTAIVTGRFSGKWTENGKPFTTEERFTSVWIKQGGRWKAVSEHASQVPTQ
jgi:ketosteroid isomerase-like protein